jgi:DDE superfamily endonuclease
MGLMYLRLYVGQSLLSLLFDIEQSNVCRELSQRLLPVLQEVLPTPLRNAPLRAEPESSAQPSQPAKSKKQRRINTLDELLRAYPDLKEVLVDATEQPIPQPKDKRKRKLAYSGKQQEHTIKTQILASKELILHVFGGLPGCLNDQVLLGASGVLHQVPPGVRVRLDKGYPGTAERYPSVAVVQPVRKRRGHQLTVLGRAYNHLLSVLRMPVEHHFARLQRFRILADVFRGRQDAHENIFCIVAGLLNYRQTGQFCLG